MSLSGCRFWKPASLVAHWYWETSHHFASYGMIQQFSLNPTTTSGSLSCWETLSKTSNTVNSSLSRPPCGLANLRWNEWQKLTWKYTSDYWKQDELRSGWAIFADECRVILPISA